MASNKRQWGKSAGLQRLALLAFAALLAVLFLIFAVAQGIGDPSIPSDAVAVVEDAPGDLGTISREEFDRALAQAAAQEQVKPAPKPGDAKYEELKSKALGELLDSIWIQGQAEEMGFTATPKELEDEFKKLKDQAFKTEKQYKEFLKESGYTQADVDTRVKIQILSTKIQESVTEDASQPSSAEIENYYEAAKTSQYTTPESREIRIVKNKDKRQVEAAKTALEKDDSIKSWEKVAKEFSTDTTKANGGLQAGITEGQLPEPFNAEVFAASQGEIEGPLDEGSVFTVFEVMKITPEKVQELDEARPQIDGQLAEQLQQQAFAAFVRGYSSRWQSRTFCAEDFLIERCANFEGNGRPPEANPACFEADPKAPADACPAPIAQVKPTQPGTVSPLNPEGQKLPQRPRPAGDEPAVAPPAGELPPGVVPEGE